MPGVFVFVFVCVSGSFREACTVYLSCIHNECVYMHTNHVAYSSGHVHDIIQYPK